MTSSTEDSRLFIAVFPTGIGYADMSKEEHGDYKRVDFCLIELCSLSRKKMQTESLLSRPGSTQLQSRRCAGKSSVFQPPVKPCFLEVDSLDFPVYLF